MRRFLLASAMALPIMAAAAPNVLDRLPVVIDDGNIISTTPGHLRFAPSIRLGQATSTADVLNVQSNAGGAFFQDVPVGGLYPSVVRLGDRMTLGYTNSNPLTENPLSGSWAANLSLGWMERGAAASIYGRNGPISLATAARASDDQADAVRLGGPNSAGSAFAQTMLALADVPGGNAEGAYIEAQTTSPNASAYGLEIDAVNKNAAGVYTNPYVFNPAGGAYGIMIAAGGDLTFQWPVSPSSFALGIGNNKTTFQRGIEFQSTGLLRSANGVGVAIEFGAGHQMQWAYDYTGVAGGYIRSTATQPGLGLAFTNSGLEIHGAADSGGAASALLGTFTPAGGLNITGTLNANAITGNSIAVTNAAIYGSETLTGSLAIGGNASIGSTTATGYPTVDIDGAAGSVRQYTFSTAGVLRWQMGDDGGANTGGNTGDSFFISAFSDTGSPLGRAISINRATNQVSMPAGINVPSGNITTGGTVTTPALIVTSSYTPPSATSACVVGQQTWDQGFAYVCVAANTWKRAALTAW